MSTKIRCTCGAMVDVAAASPGGAAACEACGGVVKVPALPPGVRHLATVAVVECADTMDVPVTADPLASLPGIRGWDERDPDDEENDVSAGLVPAAPPPPPEHLARSASVVSHAGVRVEWWYYYRRFPAGLAMGAVLVVLGLMGSVFLHPAYAVVSIVGAVAMTSEIACVRRRFCAGRPCPAVVVSDRPARVAVLCDLRAATSPNPMPAVRIFWQPLRKLGAVEQPGVGTRLAAVAELLGPVRNHTWTDFNAELVRAATRDEVVVTRVTTALAEQDWRTLEGAVATTLKGRRPGLYTLWDDNYHGRRRTTYATIGGTLATVLILAALAVPWLYLKKPQPRDGKLAPGVVPGRVHYDWNR